MRTITINGVEFELHKSDGYPVAPITGCNEDEIFEVYGRPSPTKVAIWKDWCEWCYEVNKISTLECGIEISGHNCMQFSIIGSVRNKELGDATIDLWITHYHNRAYIR
jgi:hypothetical protein